MSQTSTTTHRARWRRLARDVSRAGAVLCSVALMTHVANALPPGTAPAGSMTLTPASGDSSTVFAMGFGTPPAPQMCPGDAIASYRWSTFITPATNDAGSMIYTPSGTPSGAPAFSNNLADPIGTRVRAMTPGLGDGLVVAPIGLSFGSALFAALAPGDYKIGIACTLPDQQGVVQTVKFWSTTITITASAGAGPNNFTYGSATAPTSTTTTTTTTTSPPTGSSSTTTTTTIAGASTTSTSVAGGPTTTNPCATTTTTTTTLAAGSTTTTTTGSTTTSTTTAGPTTTTSPCVTTTTTLPHAPTTTLVASGASGNSGTSSTPLAHTGSSSWVIVMWAVLLIAFGRMAVLLGREVKVRPPS